MTLRCSAVLLGVLLVLPGPALAQRPMSIVDLISVPVVSTPAAVARRLAGGLRAGRRRLEGQQAHQPPVAGRAPTAPTRRSSPRAPTARSQPRWSPDGKWIAFVGKRDGAETAQIHLLPIEGGEARALTTHATAASSPAWSPDGRLRLLPGRGRQVRRAARRARRPRTTSTPSTRTSSMRHLWRIEVATRAETRVTSGSFSMLSYELSDDGRRIAHHRAPSTVLGDGDRGEVWVMDADGGNAVAADQQHRARERRQPLARRLAGAVPVGLERAVRDLLQRQPVRDAGRRRHGPRPDQGLRQRDHRRRVVEGRPVDLRHRQPGRAQPALRDPGRRRHAEGVDQRQPRHRRLDLRARARPPRLHQGRPGQRWRRVHDDQRRTGAGEPRVRPLRQGLPPAAPGEGGVEGRRRRRPSKGCCSTRSTTRPASATRWWCRRTAGRRPPTSSASAAGATTPRCWPPRATWCCSPTTAAAPATATRSCATWSGTTSSTRTST